MVRVLSVSSPHSSLDLVNTSSGSDQVYENVTVGDAPVSYWGGSVSVVVQRHHINNEGADNTEGDDEAHESTAQYDVASEDSDCSSFEMMMIPDFSSLAIGENLTNKTDEYQTYLEEKPTR